MLHDYCEHHKVVIPFCCGLGNVHKKANYEQANVLNSYKYENEIYFQWTTRQGEVVERTTENEVEKRSFRDYKSYYKMYLYSTFCNY